MLFTTHFAESSIKKQILHPMKMIFHFLRYLMIKRDPLLQSNSRTDERPYFT